MRTTTTVTTANTDHISDGDGDGDDDGDDTKSLILTKGIMIFRQADGALSQRRTAEGANEGDRVDLALDAFSASTSKTLRGILGGAGRCCYRLACDAVEGNVTIYTEQQA